MIYFDPTSNQDKPNFARWLLAQMKRDDMIGELARAGHRDPKFPIDGDVQDVAVRLSKLEADPDMHIALEDAELDWAAH
ncbi:hypothetical protein [Sphingobium aromaticiconvertens]|uniref:hypothetical protein n=1 Tax=Sphingobium aromaticiconvertens TaxID=365341 RepID=UPI0030190BD9